MHLTARYIERMINEVFTEKSRGGMIVIGIFFYITFVLAIAFKIEQGNLVISDGVTKPCRHMNLCFVSLK